MNMTWLAVVGLVQLLDSLLGGGAGLLTPRLAAVVAAVGRVQSISKLLKEFFVGTAYVMDRVWENGRSSDPSSMLFVPVDAFGSGHLAA